jgi:hypothetical protein
MSISSFRRKWKGKLTDRERFNRQMHFEPVDRCFNREYGYWNENFHAWPLFVQHGITNNEQAEAFFNFDVVRGLELNSNIHPEFESRIIRQTATTKIIQNINGLLAEVPQDGHDTIPHFIKSSIETPEDWQRVKAERLNVNDPWRLMDVEALRRQHPADRDYPLYVDCGSMIGRVRDLLTFEGLGYALYDYPDMVEDIVETFCQLVERALDQVLGKIEFDFAGGFEDICFKNGPMVPPSFFRDVVVPRYQRIHARLAAAGVDVQYADCDGDVRPLLPHFLAGGVNCMFPWEVNSAGHPAEPLAKYGRELLIMGGVDKMQLGKGKKAIKTYLESLEPLVKRGGFIPHCDHRCPPNVKVEDYLYYLDLKEKMFGMG